MAGGGRQNKIFVSALFLLPSTFHLLHATFIPFWRLYNWADHMPSFNGWTSCNHTALITGFKTGSFNLPGQLSRLAGRRRYCI